MDHEQKSTKDLVQSETFSEFVPGTSFLFSLAGRERNERAGHQIHPRVARSIVRWRVACGLISALEDLRSIHKQLRNGNLKQRALPIEPTLGKIYIWEFITSEDRYSTVYI
eukprot:110847-Amphidinium_carterae.1